MFSQNVMPTYFWVREGGELEVLILYICFSFLCFKFNITDGFSAFTRKLGSAAEGHKLCELINDLME